MFEFVWWPLSALLPLPLLLRYLLPAKKKNAPVALYFPHVTQVAQTQNKKTTNSIGRALILSIAWIALIFASARPIWFGDPIAIPSEGRDLMLAVDLSTSMRQKDMLINGQGVDRLEMVKSVMDDFIERRVGDRIGLILFGDTAYLQAPLTFDRNIIKQFLDESVIGLVGDSTAIGDAIGLAVKRFIEKERSNRVLILLTDGRNTAGNISIDQALALAVANQVTVYPIGVGSEQQVQNSLFGQRLINPSSDIDERALLKIAKETGGDYFRAKSTQELAQIYAILDLLEPVKGNDKTLRPREELFYYPLAAAVGSVAFIALTPLLLMLFRNVRNTSSRATADE
jgi:Ca-activated chloride channel family protein